MNKIKYYAHVIVTSDTCSQDKSRDKSGLFVVDRLKELKLFKSVGISIVSDDYEKIVACLNKVLVDPDLVLIITVGGTGLCPRDVTPEATSSLYDKTCYGIVTALLTASLRYTPLAALSRLSAGIIKGCLVINLPGSEKACRDCLSCIEGFIEHAIDSVRQDLDSVRKTHMSSVHLHVSHPKNQQHTNNRQVKQSINFHHNYQNGGFNNKQHSNNRKNSLTKPDQRKNNQQSRPADTKPKIVRTNIEITRNSERSVRCILDEVLGSSSSTEHAMGSGERASPGNSVMNQNRCDTQSPTGSTRSRGLVANFSSPNQQIISPKTTPRKVMLQESPYPLVSYEDALTTLKSHSKLLLKTDSEIKFELSNHMEAKKILNNVLAEDLIGKSLIPPRAVSTIDGYVASVPESMLKVYHLIGYVQAELLGSLEEFERVCSDRKSDIKFYCYQVNTGGQLPRSIEFAVVPTEQATLLANNRVKLNHLKQGAYIREAGSDLSDLDSLKRGTLIGPVEMSLMLNMGHRTIKVWNRPKIGIMSTGDELVSAFEGARIDGDKVMDINSLLLPNVFLAYRYPIAQLGVAKDDPDEIYQKLKHASSKCDVLVVSGGASMGSKDWVKYVIEEKLEGQIHFGRVNMKPGKPVAFATIKQEQKIIPVFCLPGNPVSAYIATFTLVLPFLEHGIKHHFDPEFPLDLNLVGGMMEVEIGELLDTDELYSFDDRLELARAKLMDSPVGKSGKKLVKVSLRQQSSRLMSLTDFDCLLLVPPNRKNKSFEIGDTYWACKLLKAM